MARLPRMSGREVVRVLGSFGWEKARQSSSHIITPFLGGLTTGGLGATDIGNERAIGGALPKSGARATHLAVLRAQRVRRQRVSRLLPIRCDECSEAAEMPVARCVLR